jgi:hypothetical protein
VTSRLLPRDVIALDQEERFGSPDWFALWHPRNRVEGSYGIVKNLAVINYCRSFHMSVGLARETLITMFATVAYIFHMLRSWEAPPALAASKSPDDGFEPFAPELPSAQPVATAPTVPPAPKPKRTPRGLPFLGGNRDGSDDPSA